MADNGSILDRALDEIVADRSTNNRNRRRGPGNRTPRDGVSKQTRPQRDPPRGNWVHDKYDDGNNNHRPREPRGDGRNREPHQSSKIRVENLHYDLGEADLRDVFSRVGDIRRIDIIYDKAGRSEGIANIIYATADEAILAVDQFDGANAKGQPIRVRLASQHERGPGGPGGRRGGHGGGGRGGGVQGGGEGRSLFERVSGTQDAEMDDNSGRSSTQRRGGPPRNVQEMRQNAKELGIDRYIPGERNGSRDRRQPPRRGGMGGERERRRDGDGRGGRGGGDRGGDRGGERTGGMNRPKKTAEELDAEMNDYWGSTGGDSTVQSAFGPGGTGEHVPQQQPQNGGSNFMAEVNAAAQSSAIDVDEDL
ncbi:hypothetical protein TWF788_001149 [Orbilia oligospora]|uniref:RRM domain-containing protein n=1 Tax=Orbilia oligospora TaxID=2813651 RepID=A0A7C8KL01_ORBOL|nr:hypothetical protein TWF788_001149 [Orbilia oligospora]